MGEEEIQRQQSPQDADRAGNKPQVLARLASEGIVEQYGAEDHPELGQGGGGIVSSPGAHQGGRQEDQDGDIQGSTLQERLAGKQAQQPG